MTAICIECAAELSLERAWTFWCGATDERHSYLFAATPASPLTASQSGPALSDAGDGAQVEPSVSKGDL